MQFPSSSIRSHCLFATISIIGLFTASALATSSRPNPLKRISYATDAWIDIVHSPQSPVSSQPISPIPQRRSTPSQVLSSDSIRLSLRGFDQTFFLHLEPNDDIVPTDGAKVKIWTVDEQTGEDVLVREERIQRESVRAYHGVVVHQSATSQRMYEDRIGISRTRMGVDDVGVMGPAAIFLHDDGAISGIPHFEGSFEWNGNTHTIQSAQAFNNARQEFDPKPHKRSLEGDHLIMHRSSDLMTEDEVETLGLRVRDSVKQTSGCSFGGHDWNANNALILSDTNNFNTSHSPLEFFAKRSEDPASPLQSMMRRGMAWWDVSASASDSIFERSEDAINVFPNGVLSRSTFSYEEEHEKLTLARRQSSDGRGSQGNTSYVSSIGDTSGCPNSAMAVYVGMAADCTFTQEYNGNTSRTSSAVLNIMNQVSIIYRNTFNVSLGVVELDVRDGSCSTGSGNAAWNRDCNTFSIDERLNAFSEWRGRQSPNGIGVWNLLTSCNSGAEVGVAWLGTLCMSSSYSSGGDTVSGTAVSASSSRIAQVVAHEIGHVFGAVHDCTDGCALRGNLAVQSGAGTCCPQSSSNCNDNAAHIMSPVAEQATTVFSACSIGNVCTLLSGGLNTSCIETPGQRETLSSQQCGNGILETAAGEECDAGPNGSACCSTDCKLVNGAVCDPSSSVCCQDTCQFAPSSTVCRGAKDSSTCDTVEYCTGSSSDCPADTFRPNGESCGSGLTCANGRCTSRDLQCQQQTGGTTSYTRSCSAGGDNACSLSCQDPSSSRFCTIFQTNFVDGTACGSGGFCQGGVCDYGAGSNGFTRWYRNNLRISIPVTIVVGILVLLILFAMLRCCFCGGGRARRSGRNQNGFMAGGGSKRNMRRGPFATANGGVPPPPPPMRNVYPSAGGNAGAGGGVGYAPPPPVPPRSYNPSSGGAPYQSYQSPSAGNRSSGATGWVDPTAWNGPALSTGGGGGGQRGSR